MSKAKELLVAITNKEFELRELRKQLYTEQCGCEHIFVLLHYVPFHKVCLECGHQEKD
jgi:hypothetical protein